MALFVTVWTTSLVTSDVAVKMEKKLATILPFFKAVTLVPYEKEINQAKAWENDYWWPKLNVASIPIKMTFGSEMVQNIIIRV